MSVYESMRIKMKMKRIKLFPKRVRRRTCYAVVIFVLLAALLNIAGPLAAMAQTTAPADSIVAQDKEVDAIGRINENAGVSLDSLAQWEEGLNVGKTAADNGDGSFRLTLEALMTGSTERKVQPVDVLMVLDLSGSLRFPYPDSSNENATRIDALRSSVQSFVTRLGEINRGMDASEISRVAMFGFSGPGDIGAENIESSYLYDICDYTALTPEGVSGLVSTAGNLNYYRGKTNTGAAMDKAVAVLDRNSDSSRKQMVVVFTDGYPNIVEGIQVSVANRAIAAARLIKEKGIELYVISIEPHTEENPEKMPTLYRVEGDDAGNQDFCYMADELQEPGYAAPASNISNDELHSNSNYFLHLLSGNNPHAADMFTPDGEDAQDGGRIVSENGINYVLTAGDADALKSLFERLAVQIGTADADLGKDAELRDFVTWPFTLRDPASVKVYCSDAVLGDDGKIAFGERRDITGEVSVYADSRSVRVTGYDYAAGYISGQEHSDRPGYYGSRLTVEFDIVPGRTFGGNGIDTNRGPGSDTPSGIYKSADSSEPEALFPVPQADLKLNYEIEAVDAVAFVPEKADITSMVQYKDWYVPDGILNAFVNITYTLYDEQGSAAGTLVIPAGKKAEDCSWNYSTRETDHCGTYHVECRVVPAKQGSYDEITREKDPQAHVYHPVVSLQDTECRVGDEPDTETGELGSSRDFGTHYISESWECRCGAAGEVPSLDVPELHYTAVFADIASLEETDNKTIIAKAGDIPVRVDVFRKMKDDNVSNITSDTRFIHACGLQSCAYVENPAQYASSNVRFLIHVEEPITVVPPGPETKKEPETKTDPEPEKTKIPEPEPEKKDPAPAPVTQTVSVSPQPVSVNVNNSPVKNVSVTQPQQTYVPTPVSAVPAPAPAPDTQARPSEGRMAVSTGDESRIAGYLGLLMTSAVSLGGWIIKRRRR